MKKKPFTEQVAIVTGGGSGIGRALTEGLAVAGAKVVIAARRRDLLSATADEINARAGAERVFPYEFDLRKAEDTANLARDVFKRWQAIDVLINNSGLAVPETVDAITDEGWDTVMETNLRGVMQLVREVLPHMRRDDFGDIVNISSQAGKHGYADVSSYCASKFGLLGYAEALREWCKYSRVQFLPRSGGRGEYPSGSSTTRRIHSRRKPCANIDVCPFA